MEVAFSVQIKEINGKVWPTLKSFQNVEKYFPIVTKSIVEGNGLEAKRTCNISIGKQEFQIKESIQSLDDEKQELVVSMDDGPLQMRGMKTKFEVKDLNNDESILKISTDVNNPDAAIMIQSIFKMIGDGLKKFHEL